MFDGRKSEPEVNWGCSIPEVNYAGGNKSG